MKRLVVLLAVLLIAGGAAIAQTTDSHLITFTLTPSALLDLDSDLDMPLELTMASGDPSNAGLAPTGSDTDTRRLWYTVISGGTAAVIQASLDTELPAGLSLQLAAANAAAGGVGTLGTGQTITVTNVAQSVVTGIGSGYTLRDGTHGVVVTYTLSMSGYTGGAVADRTLTYTISGM